MSLNKSRGPGETDRAAHSWDLPTKAHLSSLTWDTSWKPTSSACGTHYCAFYSPCMQKFLRKKNSCILCLTEDVNHRKMCLYRSFILWEIKNIWYNTCCALLILRLGARWWDWERVYLNIVHQHVCDLWPLPHCVSPQPEERICFF